MRRTISGVLALLVLAFAVCPPMAFAAGVKGTLSASFAGQYIGSNALGKPEITFSYGVSQPLTEGTAANNADKLFSDSRSISASSSENLDLAGVLTDPFGATLTFVTVKAILIKAAAGNTNDVIVGGAASNGFVGPFGGTTPTVAVRPGGTLLLVAPATGWTVTPTTGDILKVANSSSGTPVSYDVIIIGTSA